MIIKKIIGIKNSTEETVEVNCNIEVMGIEEDNKVTTISFKSNAIIAIIVIITCTNALKTLPFRNIQIMLIKKKVGKNIL